MPTLLGAYDTFSSEVQIAVRNYEDEVCCCDIIFLLCFVKGSHMIQNKLVRLSFITYLNLFGTESNEDFSGYQLRQFGM
jgi:hypothetical protein